MPADRSHTERIRHMRAKIQATIRIAYPVRPEEGPRGPVDQSTRTSRMFGQQVYYKQTANGEKIIESVCTC